MHGHCYVARILKKRKAQSVKRKAFVDIYITCKPKAQSLKPKTKIYCKHLIIVTANPIQMVLGFGL
jgi:hypothetical protein